MVTLRVFDRHRFLLAFDFIAAVAAFQDVPIYRFFSSNGHAFFFRTCCAFDIILRQITIDPVCILLPSSSMLEASGTAMQELVDNGILYCYIVHIILQKCFRNFDFISTIRQLLA